MRAKDIIKLMALMPVILFSTSSCSDWLSVDMEDGIMENKLFETNEGFLASLNGVYSKMNETYSSTLSMGVIDVMAQYYNVAQNSNHNYHVYANYKFSDSYFENTSGEIWTNLYSLIANLNTLLEHCDEKDAAIKPHYYPYIKGEALALRAMLHFDLLRIYGPIYDKTTASQTSIPYQETTSTEIQPLLPTAEVMDKIIRDLTAASDLLKEDKIRVDGVMNEDSKDPNENTDFRYRQYRLNYYAVRALLARSYLWIGNRAEAYKIAHDIITENTEAEIFPWTPKNEVQANDKPDRLFSKEVIFGLYNTLRVKLFDSLFKSTAKISNCLTFAGETMEEGADDSKINYFYSDINDLRRADNIWRVESLEEADQNGSIKSLKAICFNKYADINTNNTIRYMIPLIRMSEIYLIAAECTDDLSEAIEYINEIRKNRNCIDIEKQDNDSEETIQKYITDEFAREVIGEGQLYFYYKRNAMTTIMSGTDFGMWSSGTHSMVLQNYVWPLPKVETDKRVTSK